MPIVCLSCFLLELQCDTHGARSSQIQALRDELQRLKQSSSAMTTTTTTTPVEGSMEELQAKLVAYQQFMAKYVVKAQEEKIAAVRAAEAAAAKKYQELLLPGGAPVASAPPIQASKDNKLYMERNIKVTEAAKAGKSRWGDAEIKKAAEQVGMDVNGAIASDVVVDVPPEVIEADHGMRADGGVGGPSLAQRVAMGANGASAPASTASPVPVSPLTPVTQTAQVTRASPAVSRKQVLYHGRNEMVSAAAKAGKSRWGPLEVEKATQLAAIPIEDSTPVPVSPEVAAADHGLRSGGGVGGPSLAERVNIGAQIEQGGATTDLVSPTNGSSLYQRRNAYVSAAGQAGKCRWGSMEVEKAAMLSENALPAVVGVAAAADLADGGVGGPSLFQRVNLGAQLLKN